ncbi:MAG: hypothetical protein IPH35_16795 [Rhodoferax sp.]|nr:hypothetical protein [Rhodoferax sp.]
MQLAEGLTITSSSFFADAAQLTLSNGAIIKILGATKFTFDIGANAVAGDTTVTTGTTSGATFAQFAANWAWLRLARRQRHLGNRQTQLQHHHWR